MSSNYSSSYYINQAGDLYAVTGSNLTTGMGNYSSSSGTAINSPVNFDKKKLFLGYDNRYMFYIKTVDRKPFPLEGVTVNASLIYRETGSTIINKKCEILDYKESQIQFVIKAPDVNNLPTGLCDIVLSYTDNFGNTYPLYSDMNLRPSHTVEVTDSAGFIPKTSQTITNFNHIDGWGYSTVILGPAYYYKPNGYITVGVYCTNYTGDLFLQGTTSANPYDEDWFNLELGTQYYYHNFENFSGIEPFSFQSNLQYIRAKYQVDNVGTLDKIVVRV
jgi:hypothetical protein